MSVGFYKTGNIIAGGSNVNENLLLIDPKTYNQAAYNAYQLNLSENLVANQTYTIQFWNVDVSHTAKTASTIGLGVYWGGGTLTQVKLLGTNYFTDGHADYLCVSFTPTEAQAAHANAANLWLNIYNSPGNATGDRNMYIEKWKLEKGSIPTPWCMSGEDDGVGPAHGFFETGDMMKIYSDCISATEFIEY